ncbi:WhiB family transcriptional regulator [Streptomyces huasconensis]|uniref:WhiB family transcriptional regulator n=1 Tax=Streptomyces huasconensis TaxID=1854574 RepID=UPI0034032FF6
MKHDSIVRTSYAPAADLPINTDWRTRSVCKDEDPELFFPIGNTGPALLQIQEAKSACYRCPVMEQCLRWALETGEEAGVWGGLSEDERRSLRRQAVRNYQRHV